MTCRACRQETAWAIFDPPVLLTLQDDCRACRRAMAQAALSSDIRKLFYPLAPTLTTQDRCGDAWGSASLSPSRTWSAHAHAHFASRILQSLSGNGVGEREPLALSWSNWRQRNKTEAWKQQPGGSPFSEWPSNSFYLVGDIVTQ